MLGRSGVVSREEALKVLDGRLAMPALPSEDSSLSDALGRVLARDILSPSDQPGFDLPKEGLDSSPDVVRPAEIQKLDGEPVGLQR